MISKQHKVNQYSLKIINFLSKIINLQYNQKKDSTQNRKLNKIFSEQNDKLSTQNWKLNEIFSNQYDKLY